MTAEKKPASQPAPTTQQATPPAEPRFMFDGRAMTQAEYDAEFRQLGEKLRTAKAKEQPAK